MQHSTALRSFPYTARKAFSRVRHFLSDDSGPTAVEYAVLLSLITAAIVLSINAVGTSTSDIYDNISEQAFGSGSGGTGM